MPFEIPPHRRARIGRLVQKFPRPRPPAPPRPLASAAAPSVLARFEIQPAVNAPAARNRDGYLETMQARMRLALAMITPDWMDYRFWIYRQ
jgi:hypothetical protein